MAYPRCGRTMARYRVRRTLTSLMLLTERRTQPRDLLAAEVCATTWDFHDKVLVTRTPRSRSSSSFQWAYHLQHTHGLKVIFYNIMFSHSNNSFGWLRSPHFHPCSTTSSRKGFVKNIGGWPCCLLPENVYIFYAQ